MGEPDAWDPGSPRNRGRTRESWRQVRGLLMERDLIGVAGIPEAADAESLTAWWERRRAGTS